MPEVSSAFVTILGMGTTFFGLICIILLSLIMSKVCKIAERKTEEVPAKPTPAKPVPAAAAPVTANRGELVAAIAAAVAEEMGTDVSSLRIHSIKKV